MTGGRKSTEKSAGSSGIKSFFVSKTPQAKPKDDSPQSTKENCIDLSKDDKDTAKPAKAAPAETNMFFMSRGDRQRAIARQKELQEQEEIRQREAEELAIAQRREARIQEDMIRARKETNQMLLAKSRGTEDAKHQNPFFQARAPAPNKVATSGGGGAVESATDNAEAPEATFPAIQNIGLGSSIEAIIAANQARPNQFRKVDTHHSTIDLTLTSTSLSHAAVFPDWAARSPSSDWSSLEFSSSFTPHSGRRGMHTGSRAVVSQARIYPLAQGALNLRAVWLQWVHISLSSGCCPVSALSSAAPGLIADNLTAAPAGEDIKAPAAVLSRWLGEWAAKRRSSAADLSAVVAAGKNNKGLGGNTNTTPAKASRSRSQTSSVSNSSAKGRRGSAVKAPAGRNARNGGSSGGRKRRAVSSDSEEDEDEVEEEVSTEDDEEENEEEERGSEDEWDSDAEDEEDGGDSDDSLPPTRRGRHTSSSVASSSRAGSNQGNGEEGGEEEEEELSNVMVLEGPSGSGKSAAVHDCARLLGYKVIEVNASHTRNGATIKKLIAEAAQSAHIMDNMGGGAVFTGAGAGGGGAGGGGVSAGGGNGGTEMNLILFDEVDIAFDDEDHQLYSTIQQLAHISKCPILLTTEQPLPFFKALRAKHVKFSRPSVASPAALQSLVKSLNTVSAALTKASSTADIAVLGDSAKKPAFASMFGSARKESKTDLSTRPAASTNTTTSQVNLSAADLARLQVLCGLSDGDLRAALCTVQCFAEQFLGAKPTQQPSSTAQCSQSASQQVSAASVVDLTCSPTATALVKKNVTPQSKMAGAARSVGFGEFLSDALKLDFSLFESIPRLVGKTLSEAGVATDSDTVVVVKGPEAAGHSVNTHAPLYVPVVHDVQPRFGPCAGGFLVTLRGSHFLQSAEVDSAGGRGAAAVRVTLNGQVECPCVLKSDNTVVAYVPPVSSEGVYVLQVEVSRAISPGGRVLVARSCVSGVGGAWIHLRRRHFPLVRSAGSLQHQKVNLAQCRRLPSVASSAVVCSDQKSSSADDEEREGDGEGENTSLNDSDEEVEGEKKRRGRLSTTGKRARAESDGSESEFGRSSTGMPAKEKGESAPNKRRRRVIADDEGEEEEEEDDEDEEEGSEEGNEDEKSDSAEDNMVDVEGEEVEEEVEDDEVTSSTAPVATTAAPVVAPVADADTLQILVSKIDEALRSTLGIVRLNAHSEAFLQPVDEDEVPGYCSVIARPMDLGTVEESLAEGLYATQRRVVVNALTGESTTCDVTDVASLVEDVRLVWANCIKFNDANSLFTRFAYLTNFWFETKLFDALQAAFANFPGAKVLAEDHNGIALFVRLEFNGENVFSVPRCGTFDKCHKLRNSLNVGRMRRLLLEQQKWPKKDSSGGDGEGVSAQSQTPPQPQFLTAEEALAPELQEVPQDLSAAVAQAEERRAQLLRGPTAGSLVPGLQALSSTARRAAAGLEYEDDEGAPLLHISCEEASSDGRAGEMAALSQLSSLYDAFCDADAFTSAATGLGQYACLECDDDPADSALRTWNTTNTSPVSEDALSFAQATTSAVRLSAYGDCLRRGALSAFTCTVTVSAGADGTDSVCRSAYRSAMVSFASSSSSHARKIHGCEYLESAHLQYQLRRADHMRVLNTAANRYTSSPGNRAGSACTGLIAQHTLRSLCFVPRALAVDVFPLVSGMCRTERSNDEDVQELIRQHSLASSSNGSQLSLCSSDEPRASTVSGDLNALERSVSGDRRRTLRLVSGSSHAAMNTIDGGRRSSRRGPSSDQPRRHKCFATMKTSLSTSDEKILRQLAACYDVFSGVQNVN